MVVVTRKHRLENGNGPLAPGTNIVMPLATNPNKWRLTCPKCDVLFTVTSKELVDGAKCWSCGSNEGLLSSWHD